MLTACNSELLTAQKWICDKLQHFTEYGKRRQPRQQRPIVPTNNSEGRAATRSSKKSQAVILDSDSSESDHAAIKNFNVR